MPRFPLDKPVIPAAGSAGAFGVWRQFQGVWHWGIDVGGKPGQAVLSPDTGVVVDVKGSDNPERADNTSLKGTTPLAKAAFPSIANPYDGYGPGVVIVQGRDGLFHFLAHLATQTVKVGDPVNEGEPVGTLATHVGASGSHTHWEVRRHAVDTFQDRQTDVVDPQAWVGSTPPHPAGSALPPPEPPPGVPWWAWLLLIWVALR